MVIASTRFTVKSLSVSNCPVRMTPTAQSSLIVTRRRAVEDVWHDRRPIIAEDYNSLTSRLTSLCNKLVSLVTFVVEKVAWPIQRGTVPIEESHDQNLGTISS